MDSDNLERLLKKYQTPIPDRSLSGIPYSCSKTTHHEETPLSKPKPQNGVNDSGIIASFNSSSSTSASIIKYSRAPRIKPRSRKISSKECGVQTEPPILNDENCPPIPSGYVSASKLKEYETLLQTEKNVVQEKERANKYLTDRLKKLEDDLSTVKASSNARVDISCEDYVPVNNKQYLVQKKHIGAGASCRVFKGVDCATDRTIALKVVSLKSLQPTNHEELTREIQILHKFKDQPNIINLYDYEFMYEKCRLLLVLEYGEMDLNAYLRTRPCLVNSPTAVTYYQTLTLWHQMLCAVAVLHDHNIIHKDLKPQNFLMVQGNLKLIDFGISVGVNGESTCINISQPEGTPNYIAPEVLGGTFGNAANNQVSYRSDVFSLGCILFKMCFGVAPYQHINHMQKKYIAISSPEPVVIPETLTYADIREVLTSCLHKDRRKRPTVKELQGVKTS